MSDILLRPPQLRTIADQIRQHAKTVQQAIDAVDAKIKSLGPNRFEGIRADALRAHYKSNRDKFYNFKKILDNFAAELEASAIRFETADKTGK
jgi:WXG100 family type VII secretion target